MIESKDGKPESANTTFPIVAVTAPTGLALGLKVAQLRILHRLSREDLARRSGLSYNTIYKLETGKSQPTVATLKALDAVFGGRVERLEA